MDQQVPKPAKQNAANTSTTEQSEKKTKTAAPPAPAAPKDIFRANKTFVHRLFRSSVETGKKNVSYQKFQPKLEDIPHRHFFHTVDMKGKELHQTDFGFGHFHEVEWGTDGDGNLICKSGPPKRTVTKKMKDGRTRSMVEEVYWEDAEGNRVYDKHEHEWEYVASDNFSPNSLAANRAKNQSDLAEMGVGAVQVRPVAQARRMTEEDGIEIS